jgi:hypothetical protein
MHFLLFLLLAQTTPDLTIGPKDASTSGNLCFQGTNGNKVCLSVANPVTAHNLTWPGAASPGCLTVDGSNVLSWAACVSLPISDNSDLLQDNVNTTARARFELSAVTPGVTRVATWPDANFTMAGINITQTFTQNQTLAANLLFSTDNARVIGSDAFRAQTIFGYGGDFAAPSPAGGYVKSRKFEFADFGGAPATAFWDMLANIALTQSVLTLRDNGGLTVVQFQKQMPLAGVVDDAIWHFDQHPNADGSRSLGEPGRRWDAHIRNLTVGSCTGCSAGISSINSLTPAAQFIAVGSSGFSPNIASSGATHTINIPLAGAGVSAGLISNTTQTIFGDKIWNGSQTPSAAGVYSNGNSSFPWFNVTARRVEFPDTAGFGSGLNTITAEVNFGTQRMNFLDSSSVSMLSLTRSLFSSPVNTAVFSMNLGFNASEAYDIASSGVRARTLFTRNIDMPSYGSMTAYVGTGNFYNRTFIGSPFCGGVTDGWTGVDTFNQRIWVCIAGAARYAQLF